MIEKTLVKNLAKLCSENRTRTGMALDGSFPLHLLKHRKVLEKILESIKVKNDQ